MATSTLFDPFTYGAKGDGLTKDTEALQRALDACAAAGGGTVMLRGGTFLSGMVTLKSHTTLHLAKGATLLGSRDDADYPAVHPPTANTELAQCRRALVYAEQATHIRIEGEGTIDGHADFPRWRGLALPEGERPMAIFTARCSRVEMEQVRVVNAATWAVVHLEVEHLVIRDVTIDSPLGPTHDGFDIVDGHDVLIEDCVVTSGDDAICLKSGSAMGLSRITVRRCRILGAGCANGIKLGTASVGPIHHVLFEDIVISHAQAAAMAIESVDGSVISAVTFRRITVTDAGTPFFILLGARGQAAIGAIGAIRFEAVRAEAMGYPWGCLVTGAPADAAGEHALADISFQDLDLTFKGGCPPSGPHHFGSKAVDSERFPEYCGGYPDPKFIFASPASKEEVIDYTLPGWAFFIRHAQGVSFTNCKLKVQGPDTRVPVVTREATWDWNGGGMETPAPKRFSGLRRLAAILGASLKGCLRHRAPSKGAALAFYALFSMAPILVLAISIAGHVLGTHTARGEVFRQLRLWLSPGMAEVAQSMVMGARAPGAGRTATGVALVLMAVGGTSVFAELKDSLDEIWQQQAAIPTGFLTLVRTRALGFLLILGITVLFLASLAVNSLLGLANALLPGGLAYPALLGQGLTFGLIVVLFAAIHKILPEARIAWSDAFVGALFTGILFELGRHVIGFYLGVTAFGSSFGAAGSFAALLIWVYYCAQIFFLGAEFTREYALGLGSLSHGDQGMD